MDLIHVLEGILVGLERCFARLETLSVEMTALLVQCVALLFQRSTVPQSSLVGIANGMLGLLKAATVSLRKSPSSLYQSILETSLLAAKFLGVGISTMLAEILEESNDDDGFNFAEPLILESSHPYGVDDSDETPVCIPGAVGYKIVFSEQTSIDEDDCYLTFIDDELNFLGEEQYTGSNIENCNFPGTGGRPALEIHCTEFRVNFVSDENSQDCWGYKMTVTPVFAKMGKSRLLQPIRDLERFYSALDGLCGRQESDCSVINTIDKHLVTLLEAIISADKFPDTTVDDLLKKTWSDFAVFAESFEHYPLLVAAVAGSDKEFEGLSDNHALSIETRFDAIFQFNRDFLSCASLIDLSQVQKNSSLAFKISCCRKLLLARTKENLLRQGFSATESKTSRFELVLSRPRAAKYAAKGFCDTEGRWSVFGQAFRVIQGKDPSCLRQKTQLWDVVFAGTVDEAVLLYFHIAQCVI